jgi:hypothetical protein
MALTPDQQILIETRISNENKSPAVAFVLWFFLGIFSAHRFYLGKPVSAILQILSYLIIIGFIWWIIDAFLINGMLRDHQNVLRERLTHQYMSINNA